MSDYTELKRLAEAAPEGPWYQHGGIKQVFNHDCETVCETFEEDGDCPTARFIAAANPAAILVLIAENEALRKDLQNLRSDNAQLTYALKQQEQSYLVLRADRDQLKAENEALRRERDARHPFKPFHEPAIGFTGCVICGVYTDHGGLPCPKTRAAAIALSMENQRLTPVEPLRVPHPIEAAMGKGEQS